MRLDYSKHGLAIPDHEAEAYILDKVQKNEDVCVSTDNVFNAARALVAEGTLSSKHIILSFEGEVLLLEEDGSLLVWPKGFCDYIDNWLRRICWPKIKDC